MGSLRGSFVLLSSKTNILYYKRDFPGDTTLRFIPVIETSLYREYEGQSTIFKERTR
jgi:hypothetical protein